MTPEFIIFHRILIWELLIFTGKRSRVKKKSFKRK